MIRTMSRGLSKSRILNFLQCPRRLFLQTIRPELAEDSEEARMAFQSGNEVGEVARSLFPEGMLIGHDTELVEALRATRVALAEHPDRPLFEATFEHDGVLVRADLLVPDSSGLRLIEVKSSTEVKSHHLADCAVQAWVVRKAGVPLARIELAHVDNTFVYLGNRRYDGLLKFVDLTGIVESRLDDVPRWIDACRTTLSGSEPDIMPGTQCDDPYPCPFITHCQPPQPDEGFPVTTLYRKGRIVTELLDEGIEDLRDIPPGRLGNRTHERQRRVAVAGKAELDSEAGELLRSFGYPRYYLDYETIAFAVPIWPNTRPYQKLPYQWSCHIESADGSLGHQEFLGIGPDAPMRAFAESLVQKLSSADGGPAFVFRQSFEEGRTRELAQMFPDLADRLLAICERMVDLLPIAQKHYYHPEMHGSWSIKAILPTIAPELSYSGLGEVQDGGGASVAYLELLDPATDSARRAALIHDLREYCKLDTLAMVKLARYFLKGSA